jgi:hypothetical protein
MWRGEPDQQTDGVETLYLCDVTMPLEEWTTKRETAAVWLSAGSLSLPDFRAEVERLSKKLGEALGRRAAARKSQALSGAADCGARHWDVRELSCRPD